MDRDPRLPHVQATPPPLPPGAPPPAPKELVCPITQELMVDPVFAEDGFSYERVTFRKELKENEALVRVALTC